MAYSRRMESVPPPATGNALRSRLEFGVLCVVGLAMLNWTWGTWPDVLVDFGRELYVPWRLSEGDVLYRDVAHFNGPLSPYWNALWFKLFGVGLRTLVGVNLALLALMTGLLWRLLRDISDSFAATAACAVFLLVFAFGQLVGIGNYNWVCPYSHEATHGVVLGLAALSCLHAWAGTRHDLRVALAGFLIGSAFLTQANVFLAAAGAGVLYFGLLLWRVAPARARAVRLVVLFMGGSVTAPAIAFVLLAFALPVGDALRAVGGAWPAVVAGDVAWLVFYASGTGFDQPLAQLGRILLWTAGYALVLAPAAAVAWLVKVPAHRPAAIAVFLTTAGGLFLCRGEIDWAHAALPLPVFLLVAGALHAASLRRSKSAQADTTRLLALALAAFAFLLLLKMPLNARVYHYGFSLAAPATLVVIVGALCWLPRWLERHGKCGLILRAGVAALLSVGVAEHLGIVASYLEHKQVVVGEGADAFRADARGDFVNAALAIVIESVGEGDSLAVLPEGVTINYLARRRTPTRYLNFMPPELSLFGEAQIVASFKASPPDLVLLVHKDTSEYGVRFFGHDYGNELASWVREHYVDQQLLGQRPLEPATRFGIATMTPAKR